MSNLSLQIQFPLRARTAARRPRQDPGRLPNVTRALALAIYYEDLITRGEVEDYASLARMLGMSRERISQIVRLIYLAPDLQVEILYLPATASGRYPISETAARKIANLLSWEEQRTAWSKLKASHQLR